MISRIPLWSWDLTDESDWLGGVGVRAILRRRKQQCSLREELPLLWLCWVRSHFSLDLIYFFFSSLFSSVTLSYPCFPCFVTLGLSCCAQAFPSCSEDGLLPRCGVVFSLPWLLLWVRGPYRLQTAVVTVCGFSSCASWAQMSFGM